MPAGRFAVTPLVLPAADHHSHPSPPRQHSPPAGRPGPPASTAHPRRRRLAGRLGCGFWFALRAALAARLLSLQPQLPLLLSPRSHHPPRHPPAHLFCHFFCFSGCPPAGAVCHWYPTMDAGCQHCEERFLSVAVAHGLCAPEARCLTLAQVGGGGGARQCRVSPCTCLPLCSTSCSWESCSLFCLPAH